MPYVGRVPSAVPVTADDIPANSIDASKIVDGSIELAEIADNAITDAKIAGMSSSKLSGALPAIDGSALTGVATDTSTIENNIAMLGFYRATDHSKAKYNLVDQVVDDFNDVTGIDAANSTSELLLNGAYSGASVYPQFGDSSDGSLSTSGNVTHTVQNKNGSYDGDMVIKEYSSLTINSGHTMTVDQPCRGLMILVNGDCTINGTLSMHARGASANPSSSGGSDNNAVGASGLQVGFATTSGSSSFTNDGTGYNGCGTAVRSTLATFNNLSSNGVIATIQRTGAAGDPGKSSHNNTSGSNGSTGQSGGGGAGGWDGSNTVSVSGAGAAGTCFSGGSGGGGSTTSGGHSSLDAVAYGGAGGNANGSAGAQGGVGNPAGTSTGGGQGGVGTGGLLVLVVKGNLTIGGSGVVTAKGVDGSGNSRYAAGGGSGGGNIIYAYGGTLSNSGSITANGGHGQPTATGGDASTYADGGNGSVQAISNLTQTSTGGNLILQSVASTASSAPSTSDLVTLIENSEGTATVNTDIKGYVSRDGGSNWTQGTLIDEGSWGTNKKILAFHNLDISSQPSGTSLKYKITTHNQSSGSKQTKIHATSLAWA